MKNNLNKKKYKFIALFSAICFASSVFAIPSKSECEYVEDAPVRKHEEYRFLLKILGLGAVAAIPVMYCFLSKADQRVLSPIIDDSGSMLTPRKGIPNIGNSCYMNAAVQLLFSTEAFREGILETRVFDKQAEKDKRNALKNLYENPSKKTATAFANLSNHTGKQDDSALFLMKVVSDFFPYRIQIPWVEIPSMMGNFELQNSIEFSHIKEFTGKIDCEELINKYLDILRNLRIRIPENITKRGRKALETLLCGELWPIKEWYDGILENSATKEKAELFFRIKKMKIIFEKDDVSFLQNVEFLLEKKLFPKREMMNENYQISFKSSKDEITEAVDRYARNLGIALPSNEKEYKKMRRKIKLIISGKYWLKTGDIEDFDKKTEDEKFGSIYENIDKHTREYESLLYLLENNLFPSESIKLEEIKKENLGLNLWRILSKVKKPQKKYLIIFVSCPTNIMNLLSI
ncbi:MAG: hypothetical protein LBK29_01985 [Oscillospiraceae bacterium]|nr:hypothetical protein [Oscillospiraceae bacterium]